MSFPELLPNKVSVVILAAGESERMGFPKLFLPYNERENFVTHIIKIYFQLGFTDIVVVLNETTFQMKPFIERTRFSNAQVVVNDKPILGRIHSLQLAFKKMLNEKCLVHNIDNPFVNEDVVKKILSVEVQDGYVVPVFQQRGGHPVLILSNVIAYIKSLNDYTLKLNEILAFYKRTSVQVDTEIIHLNINTFEEYVNYFIK